MLVLVALFVIGPDRLPKVISDVLGGLRKIRSMARTATTDLSRELGTTIELEDLHPKTFLRKHLLSEAEEDALRRPFQDILRDVKDVADSFDLDKGLEAGKGTAASTEARKAVDFTKAGATSGSDAGASAATPALTTPPSAAARVGRYDDAT